MSVVGAAPLPELTVEAAVVLASEATKLRALAADLNVEKDSEVRYLKGLMLDEHERKLTDWLRSLKERESKAFGALTSSIGPPVMDRLFAFEVGDWNSELSDVDVMTALWHQVACRRDLVMFLTDLSLFRPWAPGGLKAKKAEAQHETTAALKNLGVAVGEHDRLDVFRAEIEKNHRILEGVFAPKAATLHQALDRSAQFMQRPGGRSTVIGFGLAVGALTGGLAAPAIGAAFAPAGLAGAAATSAGLAALGGGSLAVGGYGMLGGTVLIQALAAGVGGLGAAEFGQAAKKAETKVMRGVSADAYAAEFSQLLVLVDRYLLNSAEGGEAVERIRATLRKAQDEHVREQELLRSSAKSDKYGMGRKVKLITNALGRLDEIIDSTKKS